MLVRQLTDGCEVDQALLVREVELRRTKAGGEYLKLAVGDRTGAVSAMVWERVADYRPHLRAGMVLRIVGSYSEHPRYGAQITVRSLHRPDEGSYDLSDLLDGPPRSAEQMQAELRQLVATVRDPALAELLDRIIGPGAPTWPAYRDAPAAKTFHQAYRHGLLEHSLTVGQAVHAVSNTFPGIDHDVAVTGALLHDIGKLEAYASDGLRIEMTDAGRLQGEIVLGYTFVRRTIESIDGFPPDRAEALLHVILSHHGSLEHGSPVVPCTREATLVHFVDNLGGRLGSFDRLEKELPEGERWSGFDRALGGGAYFPAGRAPLEQRRAEAA